MWKDDNRWKSVQASEKLDYERKKSSLLALFKKVAKNF